MTKKERLLILKAKQALDSALEYLHNDDFEPSERQLMDAKNVLSKMLGESSELES